VNTQGELLCAGDVMTRTFVAVEPEDTIGEVAEKLSRAEAGSALVVEFGELIGILTSRDVLRMVAGRAHPSEARVREWMTPEPVTAVPDTPVEEAAHAMIAGGFHHLPVIHDGRPLGVIGLRAVIGTLTTGFPGW
jgi:CBS domain-containing protein